MRKLLVEKNEKALETTQGSETAEQDTKDLNQQRLEQPITCLTTFTMCHPTTTGRKGDKVATPCYRCWICTHPVHANFAHQNATSPLLQNIGHIIKACREKKDQISQQSSIVKKPTT